VRGKVLPEFKVLGPEERVLDLPQP
jgi:hypothetical protein